jgi:Uma2 family endonuclease
MSPPATLPQGVDPEHGPAILERMDSVVASASRQPSVRLVPESPDVEDAWVLAEADMPESNLHRDIVDLLRLILLAWVVRSCRDALVAANLACRWNVLKRRLGVDPDVALIEPAPPEGAKVKSLLTWKPGHVPPRFAVEVVSETNAAKDYVDAPAKFARLGTRELTIFDPTLIGPRVRGGPHVVQVWRRDERRGRMRRVYAGEGPAFSEELGAWLVVTAEPRLRIADDPEGRSLWLTDAEDQAAAREQAEQAKQAAEQAKQAAEQAKQAAEQQAVRAMRAAVEDVCEMCGLTLDITRRAQIERLDIAGLEELRSRIKKERLWPER